MARKQDKKNRSGGGGGSGRSMPSGGYKEDSSDSDSAFNDTSSINSSYSCVNSVRYETNSPDEHTLKHTQDGLNVEDEDISEIDDFEAKLEFVLDSLQSSKSVKQRLVHYESLAKAFTTRFCFDYLENRKITLQDIFERGIKRTDDEAGVAAFAFSLVLITMGTSDFCDELFRELYAQLNRTFLDGSVKPAIREKCATALSLGCFITDYGMEKTCEHLSQLLSVAFAPVKGKLDSNQMSAIFGLQATCLDLFSFLVSIESDSFIEKCFEEYIDQLNDCLELPNLSLRVAAGECIALLFEKSKELDEDFEHYTIDELCSKLQSLATESKKSRSKKELREQRSNFRQILRTFQGDSFGREVVKVGHERLVIDSWQMKRYYDGLCTVLGSGMNIHLAQNLLLRDIFNMGPVAIHSQQSLKMSKIEKHFVNNCNRKSREINRNRMRGKRTDYDL